MGRAIAKPINWLLLLGFILQPNLQNILCLIEWSYLLAFKIRLMFYSLKNHPSIQQRLINKFIVYR